MLFNSYIFWLFFAIVYALYRVLSHKNQNRMLLAASYIFYGWWDYRFLILITLSTVVDYWIARILEDAPERNRKRWVVLSLVLNFGLLGFFKYYNFFAFELNSLMQLLGMGSHLPILNIILPVGISFYTFQSLSYTIDVYRREIPASRSLFSFALYVSFFPQLVAGPIERSSHLLPQVLTPRLHRRGDFAEGLMHILVGLFRKVVIADNMAPIANHVFNLPPDQLTALDVLIGLYAFAFQIYGDFAGYSSMAQGIAKWMGFDLMFNFRAPYFAISPSDFWRRWHISLSTWLRDYLYIPLGGNRGSRLKTNRNLLLTMLLGGLWHGAAMTFVVWGLLHGVLLILFRSFESRLSRVRGPIRALGALLFFHLTCLTWLPFRASSSDQVWTMLGKLGTWHAPSTFALFGIGSFVFYILPLLVFEFWLEKKDDMLALARSPFLVQAAIYSYICLMLVVFPPLVNQVFIYFQF